MTTEEIATRTECLHRADREEALARYERLRRARTRAVQRSSWTASDLLHLPDGPRAEQRNRALENIPDTLRCIHSHDARATAAA